MGSKYYGLICFSIRRWWQQWIHPIYCLCLAGELASCWSLHVVDMLAKCWQKCWQNVRKMLAKCWQNVKDFQKNCDVLQHFVWHRHKIHLSNPCWEENYEQPHLHKDKQIFLIVSKLPKDLLEVYCDSFEKNENWCILVFFRCMLPNFILLYIYFFYLFY